MSGHQEVLTVFYINHMKTHRIRIHIAAPQELRQKVRLKLRQRQLREQLPVLLQGKNRLPELGRITIIPKNNTSGNLYKSYDDGYDDVYMEGDYDDDRYNRDSDYADGVDDAIEDDYEEGDGDW